MNLQIELFKNYYKLDDFIGLWVIPTLKSLIKSKIYENIPLLNSKYNDPHLIQILLKSINHLTITHLNSKNKIIITIDPNYFCVEKNAKLYDICTQVNYGSLQCPACPIFTEVFDYMARNFWHFYNDYQIGILPCL